MTHNTTRADRRPTESPRLHPVATAALAMLLGLGGAGTPCPAAAQPASAATPAPPQAWNLPSGPLNDTLASIARQSGRSIISASDLVTHHQAPAIQGHFSAEEAARRALADSGLRLALTANGTLTVVRDDNPSEHATDTTTHDTGSTTTLRTVVVTAQAEHDGITEGTGTLASRHAQAGGKATQRLRDIPKSVTVLTSQEIDDKHILQMTEAMAQIAGITVASDARVQQMYSRGFTVSNLQIDGGSAQAMSEGYGAGVDGLFGLPNMAAYDHIEVVRGADGLFSGNGEPGATVNLVRKRPTLERQFQFATSVGSWSDYRVTLDASGPLNEAGSLRGRAILTGQDSDSWFDTVWNKDTFLYGVLEADLGNQTVLTLGASYDDNSGSHYERSQTWRAGNLNGQFIGDAHNTWNLPWSNYQQKTRQVFSKLEHHLFDDWKLNASLTWQDQKGADLYARTTWFNSDTGLGQLVAWDARTYNRQIMADVNLAGSFELWHRRHDVVVGTDSHQSRGYWRSHYPSSGPVAISEVIPRPTAEDLAHWTGSDFDSTVPDASRRRGHYGSLRLHVTDPLKLIVGGRYSKHTSNTGEGSIGKLVPFAGLTYDLHPDWTAFTSVSEIYQPLYKKVPVGQYNGDPDKITWKDDPTTGRNYEIGVKGDLQGGALQVAASLFYIDKRNVWVSDTAQGEVTISGYGKTYMMRPAADVTSKGIDLEAKGILAPGWQLSAGYTYNITKDNGNEGKPLLAFAPKHTLKLWSTYQFPGSGSDWRVGAGIQAFSKSEFQFGYGVYDASLGYRINRNLSLDFIVKNLGDKAYRNATWDGPVWALPRHYMLTLRGQF